MTHSSTTNRFHLNDRYRDARAGIRPDLFVIHHTAGTNDAVAEETVAGYGRTSSANYFINNRGEIVCVVDEDFGAWSVANHRWERRAISVEVVNNSVNGWTISAAAAESLARLVAEVTKRRGIPTDRAHVIGHQEVLTRFGVGYSTAGPGGIPLDAVVNRARQINGAGGAAPAKPSKPAPGKPTGQKAPAFPLPKGSYFGPKSGPANSVSGYYSHREDLKRFVAQLMKRGWTFPKFGNDGLYGDELRGNVLAFQREKGLEADGLIGPDTWRAAWEAPVS